MYSNTSFMLFGLIGVLVTRLLLKPDLSMDVAYDELKTISRGKILMNRNVLDLETSQGEKFRMMVKWDQWFPELQNALTGAGYKVTPAGDNVWSVSK